MLPWIVFLARPEAVGGGQAVLGTAHRRCGQPVCPNGPAFRRRRGRSLARRSRFGAWEGKDAMPASASSRASFAVSRTTAMLIERADAPSKLHRSEPPEAISTRDSQSSRNTRKSLKTHDRIPIYPERPGARLFSQILHRKTQRIGFFGAATIRSGSRRPRPSQGHRPGAYFPSSSRWESVFLCFAGLWRFSTMTRSGGGRPMPRRARRLASLATLNFDFLRRVMASAYQKHAWRAVRSGSGRVGTPSRAFGGSVWESNPPFWPLRTESMALKATKVTGPLSPPNCVRD
jgi:hypothetical protein